MTNFTNIIVNRKGLTPNAYMKTVKIINIISPNQNYIITSNNLTKTDKTDTKHIPSINNLPDRYIILEGIWDHKITNSGKESNILGQNGTFRSNMSLLSIPVTPTNDINLGFYGALLYKTGDVINLKHNKELPLTYMDVGNEYVSNYIYQKGDGVYLEYHNTPHFHTPLNEDASGYLVLGKYDEQKNKLILSAFKIPYGYAIYTPKYTIHNDLFLVGDYMVVYTKTDIYSTVIMKCNDKLMDVIID